MGCRLARSSHCLSGMNLSKLTPVARKRVKRAIRKFHKYTAPKRKLGGIRTHKVTLAWARTWNRARRVLGLTLVSGLTLAPHAQDGAS